MSWSSVVAIPILKAHNHSQVHLIRMFYDEEANVWCAICGSIPLALESDDYDKLVTRVKIAAPEMLRQNGLTNSDYTLFFQKIDNG